MISCYGRTALHAGFCLTCPSGAHIHFARRYSSACRFATDAFLPLRCSPRMLAWLATALPYRLPATYAATLPCGIRLFSPYLPAPVVALLFPLLAYATLPSGRTDVHAARIVAVLLFATLIAIVPDLPVT